MEEKELNQTLPKQDSLSLYDDNESQNIYVSINAYVRKLLTRDERS